MAIKTASGSSLSNSLSSGLVLLNTTSFSGVASQSFNNVFTTTYSAYKIVTNLTTTTPDPAYLLMRLRGSGTDVTTGYRHQYIFGNNTATGGARDFVTQWLISYVFSNRPSVTTFDVYNPAATDTTTGYIHTIENPIGNIGINLNVYGIDDLLAYDGCTIYPNSGNMTGSISILGYTA